MFHELVFRTSAITGTMPWRADLEYWLNDGGLEYIEVRDQEPKCALVNYFHNRIPHHGDARW